MELFFPGSGAIPAILVLTMIAVGCGGGSGGGTVGPEPAYVEGEWDRTGTVARDDCQLATYLAVTSVTMTITQDDDVILVSTRGLTDDIPASSGIGTISGRTLTIEYIYQGEVRYSATAVCTMSVQQRDEGVVDSDEMVGDTTLDVTLTGSSCPFVSRRCPIEASFSAAR